MGVGSGNVGYGYLRREHEYLLATMKRKFLLNGDDRRAI